MNAAIDAALAVVRQSEYADVLQLNNGLNATVARFWSLEEAVKFISLVTPDQDPQGYLLTLLENFYNWMAELYPDFIWGGRWEEICQLIIDGQAVICLDPQKENYVIAFCKYELHREDGNPTYAELGADTVDPSYQRNGINSQNTMQRLLMIAAHQNRIDEDITPIMVLHPNNTGTISVIQRLVRMLRLNITYEDLVMREWPTGVPAGELPEEVCVDLTPIMQALVAQNTATSAQ